MVKVISERVQLRKETVHWVISGTFGQLDFDRVILAAGPSLKPLLEQIGFHADIRPQKGQLIVFQTPYANSQEWPVAMLEAGKPILSHSTMGLY